jgi:tripartite-type tricarboxylate transporter receptor subunit TctC
MNTRHALLATLTIATSTLAILPHTAQAQTWPARSVRVIVPFTPGGGVDIVARAITMKMQENLGQPFVIDNRAGAGSNIGIEAAAQSAPDGYTLLVASSAIAINPSIYKELRYDALTDLAPISLTSVVPLVLVTSPKLPVQTVAEIIALAKGAKTPPSYASAGLGNSTHLAMELLRMSAGINLLHIPYKSTSQKNTDVISGQVDMMFAAPPSVANFIRSRQMKGIAVSGARRSSVLPDLPTVAEAGVAGYDFVSWNGMFAPAKTPTAIINQVHGELVKITSNPEIRTRLANEGADPVSNTPAEFAAYIKSEIAKYAKLVAATGIPKE